MSAPSIWKSSAVLKSSTQLTSTIPFPSTTIRSFSAIPHLAAKKVSNKEKAAKDKAKRRQKKHPEYKQHDLKDMQRFALCDAMRFIKAFEVGRDPKVPKYDIAIKLKTKRDGPVIRNQIRLPNAVKTDIRIAVICPPDHKAAAAARAAGATYVGEDLIFERVKQGNIDFDRCLAHPISLPKLAKEGMGKILGPRGLMPSAKLGTVSENLGPTVQSMLGGSMYRERQGVVRMAVGQLAFTPEQLRDNVKAFVTQVKAEAAKLSDQFPKDIYEVVLSSTNSPGFSLTGEFKSEHSPPSAVLSAI